MTRAPQERRLRTRQALTEAARQIALEQGLGGLRAESVVARAGVAKGTFFSHFPDKDHLIATLVAERLRAVPSPGAAQDPAQIIADFTPLLALMLSEPEVLVVMTRFLGPEGAEIDMSAAIHDRILAVARQIGAAQAMGDAVRSADPVDLAEGLIGFGFHAAASALCLTTPGAPLQDACARFSRLALLWL